MASFKLESGPLRQQVFIGGVFTILIGIALLMFVGGIGLLVMIAGIVMALAGKYASS
jgi:hypothetical protein